jgi:hypothetical protein
MPQEQILSSLYIGRARFFSDLCQQLSETKIFTFVHRAGKLREIVVDVRGQLGLAVSVLQLDVSSAFQLILKSSDVNGLVGLGLRVQTRPDHVILSSDQPGPWSLPS